MSIILERRLNVSGNDFGVLLRIFLPENFYDPDRSPEFMAHLEIMGGGFSVSREELGIDGMQAVMSAMTTACALLYASDLWKAGHLTWLNSRDLGLPIHPEYRPNRDRPPWDDK